MGKYYQRTLKAMRDPKKAKLYAIMLLKGIYYKMKYKILRKKVFIGKYFMVDGKIDIVGPGKVKIGDKVQIWGKVTPWTYSEDAQIKIGNNVVLDGARFGCKEMITIGDDCLIGESRFLDTDFHSVYPDVRNDPRYILCAPIVIGRNVWITMNCVITKGVSVGSGTTITPNSAVYKNVPENSIYGGNPAKLIKKLEELPPKYIKREVDNSGIEKDITR